MSSPEPDLSAFPVIRIDQVPNVESNVLQNAILEATELAKSMNADEGPKPPLLFYLQRQLKAMYDELASRDAKNRIHNFLAGKNLLLTPLAISNNDLQDNLHGQSATTEYSNSLRTEKSTVSKSTDYSRLAADVSPVMRTFSAPDALTTAVTAIGPLSSSLEVNNKPLVPKIAFKRIPLPSELAWQGDGIKSDQKSEKQEGKSSMTSRLHELKPSVWRGDEGITKGGDCKEDMLISSRSEGSKYAAENNDDVSISMRSEGQLSSNSYNNEYSAKKKAPRRSTSASISNNNISNNNPEKGSPSKKASTALYKDFGSQFLVAATEKKLRFYPKKVVVESSEEVKGRERVDRRKAAMRRLIERREQQQARTAANQLKKRQQKLQIEKQIAQKNSNISDESSSQSVNKVSELIVSSDDSESVSGGDDDDGVDGDEDVVDPLVLQRVSDAFNKAVNEEIKVNQDDNDVVKDSAFRGGEDEESSLQREETVQSRRSNSEVKVNKKKVIESELGNGLSVTSTVRSREKRFDGIDSTVKIADRDKLQRDRKNEAIGGIKDVRFSCSKVSSTSLRTGGTSSNIDSHPSTDTDTVTLSSRSKLSIPVKRVSRFAEQEETHYSMSKIDKGPGPDNEKDEGEHAIQMRITNGMMKIKVVPDNRSHPTEIVIDSKTETEEGENKVERKEIVIERDEVEVIEDDEGKEEASRKLVSEALITKESYMLHIVGIQHRLNGADDAGDHICLVGGDNITMESGGKEVATLEGITGESSSSNSNTALDETHQLKLNEQQASAALNLKRPQQVGAEEKMNGEKQLRPSKDGSQDILETCLRDLDSHDLHEGLVKEHHERIIKKQDHATNVDLDDDFDCGRYSNKRELSYINDDSQRLLGGRVVNVRHSNSAFEDSEDIANAGRINGDKVSYVEATDENITVHEVANREENRVNAGDEDEDEDEEDDGNESEGSEEESSEEEEEDAAIAPLVKLYNVSPPNSELFRELPLPISLSSIHPPADRNSLYNDVDDDNENKINGAETETGTTTLTLANASTYSSVIPTPNVSGSTDSENTTKPSTNSLIAKCQNLNTNKIDPIIYNDKMNIDDNITVNKKTANNSETNSTNTNTNTNTKKPLKIKLADFYPHIGMIFPIAYGCAGNLQAEGFSARALIESMQFQGKLYQEWMEVMGDYATVFSQDRGLPVTTGERNSTGTGIGAAALSSSSSVYSGGTRALHFRVKASIRPEVYNIVTDVFHSSLPLWNELPSGLGLGLSWNLLWTWSKPRLNMTHLLIWQRVNHFEGSKELTRKDLLKKNIQRYTDMSGKGSEAFEIMPQTFQLPHEYTLFVNAFMACQARTLCEKGLQNFWIMKPVGLSRGRGIVLVKDIATLTYSQTSVIQRYIEDPLCLDGYKFDLRLYVLVTSFKPLEAFIYTEGFARISTDKYSLDPADMENKFIHLTNSSIQKLNAKGISEDNPLMNCAEDSGGSKISLKGPHGLWKRLEGRGFNIQTLWKNISLVVLKSLVMIDEKMSHQPCCFEVFGYDVLIDSQLRCWLIEVNASPSMARDNNLDIRVKNAMIRDTISLVNPAPFDRAAVARVLKRRLSDISKNKFLLNKNDPDLEKDLKDILGDFVPRKYGEDPVTMGEYEKLCPTTKLHDAVLKMKSRIIKSL